MIRLEHLSKSFGKRLALDDVSLEVAKGKIFGLLGHNGSGKSTLFGLLLGLLHPTSGEAFIRGVSVQRERIRALQRVGAIFEAPAFHDYLSGWNNLLNLLSYSGPASRTEMENIVRLVGLENRIHDPVRVYSQGMKQRLALAQALLPLPDVLLLDEPAHGLDPEGIQEMRHLIFQLNREHGMTVLLSSHLLSEIEQLCSRIAILNQGQLIFQGDWKELAPAKKRFRLRLANWDGARVALEKCQATLIEREIVELRAESDIADLIAALVRDGVRIEAVEPLRETLEEIYLRKASAR